MKQLLWGDLHNHCGITYGTGSLGDALRLARAQLDFCSVTPHAFWPDMPARNDDTAFILDFHNKGFAKIAANWNDYADAIETANSPGEFSTFFSFEMHSVRWGDHTFVSPDRAARIAREATPRAVIAANAGAGMIAIPHHIGYTPGYRGIDWDGFDGDISPVVEVLSKHGCAMHEHAGHPYYHNMGPLDPRNTVFAGLRQGKRFAFAGSTDHHAGCPGSCGDGKMAVLAEANTRAAIWDALQAGRTYAVSGCRIACGFTVNDAPFGSRIPAGKGAARIAYDVTAGGAIDRIILYRDCEPFRIVDGLLLPPEGGRCKIKLEFGWGNSDGPYRWDVTAKIDGGRLIGAEPCFRGRSMLSPAERLTDTDNINAIAMTLSVPDGRTAHAICDTFKNVSTQHPSTSAVILEIEGDENTALECAFNGRAERARLKELLRAGRTGHMKPYNSQAYKIHTAVPQGRYTAAGAFTDPAPGKFYHMEVVQRDNDRAFVSPVFLE